MTEIDQIEKFLKEIGWKVMRDGESQYAPLICYEDEKPENKITISPYPAEDDEADEIRITPIQFYFEYNIDEKLFNQDNFSDILLQKSKELPYGTLNIFENRIYYKYVMICTNNKVDNVIVYDIMGVLLYVRDNVFNSM